MDIDGPGVKLEDAVDGNFMHDLHVTEDLINEDFARAQRCEEQGTRFTRPKCKDPFVKGETDVPDWMVGHSFAVFEKIEEGVRVEPRDYTRHPNLTGVVCRIRDDGKFDIAGEKGVVTSVCGKDVTPVREDGAQRGELWIVRIDDADVRHEGGINADFIRDYFGKNFPNQRLLSDLDYGTDLFGGGEETKWGVVLAPPQLGALENYASTASDIGKEWKEKGWLEKTSHIPHIPFSAVPVGSVAKKGTTKRRRTTNLSMGEVHACISRRGLSVNECIDLQANFPELHLTKIKEIRESGEILGASYIHVVSEQRRSGVSKEWSSEKFLQVTAGLSDLEAYFRQFLQSVRDRLRTMVFMKLPSDSCAAYFKDGRLQFGSCSGPVFGCDLSDVMVTIVNQEQDKWENEVLKDATRRFPNNTARRLYPRELIQLLRGRTEVDPESPGAARPFWMHQFVDDFSSMALGMLRTLRILLNYWKVCRRLNLPVGYAKTETGTLFTNLGADFYLARRQVKSTERKRRLFDRWVQRTKEAGNTIEQEEFESQIGTFGFGAQVTRDVKPLMSRCHAAVHSTVWRRGRLTLFTQAVKNDMVLVGEKLVENEGVDFVDSEELWLNPTLKLGYGWTDSCREDDPEEWSGMGGYCLQSGFAWYYRFDEIEWEMWIHVTEALAALVNLIINREDLRGHRFVEMIDNHCVVHVNTSSRTRDKRLKLMGRMRHRVLEKYGISIRSLLLPSKINVIGDTISRGDFDGFRREIKRRGFSIAGDKIVNLRECLPPDFKVLADTLVKYSREMKAEKEAKAERAQEGSGVRFGEAEHPGPKHWRERMETKMSKEWERGENKGYEASTRLTSIPWKQRLETVNERRATAEILFSDRHSVHSSGGRPRFDTAKVRPTLPPAFSVGGDPDGESKACVDGDAVLNTRVDRVAARDQEISSSSLSSGREEKRVRDKVIMSHKGRGHILNSWKDRMEKVARDDPQRRNRKFEQEEWRLRKRRKLNRYRDSRVEGDDFTHERRKEDQGSRGRDTPKCHEERSSSILLKSKKIGEGSLLACVEENGMLWEQTQERVSTLPPSQRPKGFKRMREDNELGMLVMRTESKLKGATFEDIKSMRARAKEASKSECTGMKGKYLEVLDDMAQATMNANLAPGSFQNMGTAINAWGRFVKAVGIGYLLPILPPIGDPRRPTTENYLKKLYACFCQHTFVTINPKDKILGDPKTARTYASLVAQASARIGNDHRDIIAETLRQFKRGADRFSIKYRGKRTKVIKAAFELNQIKRWFANNHSLKTKTGTDLFSGIGLVYGAMIVFNTQKGHRRSEYTDGGDGFDPDWILSRAHVRYFWNKDGRDIEILEPDPDTLRAWRLTASEGTSKLLTKPPLMKNDQLGAVHGNRWTPLPLTTDDICGADWIARMEIEDPVVAREEREQTSLFRDPKTKNPIRTHIFDKVVMEIIYHDLKSRGAHISMAEVRRIYSLHSFRVTATNLLMAAGAPPHLRKILGRWSSDSGMETYTREEMEEMVHFMKQQSKQLTTSFQLPGMAPGVMTGGRLQGISRGAKLDAIGMGEIEIATGIIEDSYTGQTVKKIGRKTRQETDIQDLEGQIEILPGQELLREEMSVLNIEGGRDTQDEMLEKEDEYSEESEEETSRVFLIPKDMQILPRPLKLGKEMVGLLISKHFGDFGWGQGKIKGYNSKRKFPFEIKWSDEQKSRFHQLTLDEYMEGGKEREAKAGDFTIFVKAKEK